MSFNSNDPCGASGLAADISAITSASAYVMPVMTGTYLRDTRAVRGHIAFDGEVIEEQARLGLEDVRVHIFKAGFLGHPNNVGVVASIASDYPDVPLITYMSDLSWWDDVSIEQYQDAVSDLLLPQTAILVGNYNSLCRWLYPDWSLDKPPTARELARKAHHYGASYTLVTGQAMPDQFLANDLVTPDATLVSARFERFEARFAGAGDTLSAALAGLLATGLELPQAVTESLAYLDETLDAGFQPGMGLAVPDRLFWAQPDEEVAEVGDVDENPHQAQPQGMPDNRCHP
ncbi:MAG: Hydroxymethylpyrimidine/phosphomethylpyrimidine kinase [Pseudomonadota bacterium]|jgi:hydroxymethylpyrimidine/phosphomethylpyrimidine kinase